MVGVFTSTTRGDLAQHSQADSVAADLHGRHKEVERYINERVKAARADAPPAAKKGKAKPGPSKGFGS